jgi:hypothetical protein
MNQRDPLESLAAREAEFRLASRRSIWKPMVWFVTLWTVTWFILTEIFPYTGPSGWWPVPIVPWAIGSGIGFGGIAVWRRLRPEVAWPAMMWGLPWRDRRAIYGAMWKRRALDDARLLPIVEDLAEKMQRTRWFLTALLSTYASVGVAFAIWGEIGRAAFIIAGVFIMGADWAFIARRSRLVVQLTNNNPPSPTPSQ